MPVLADLIPALTDLIQASQGLSYQSVHASERLKLTIQCQRYVPLVLANAPMHDQVHAADRSSKWRKFDSRLAGELKPS